MSDHVVLYVDRLMRRESVQEKADVAVMAESSGSSADGAVTAESSGSSGGGGDGGAENETRPSCSAGNAGKEEGGEDEPLIQVGECRICQDEDSFNNLETPCACSGSLKYAHRKCVQRWCNEKGDITCEICHQQYQSNYTAPPCLEETAIDIGGGWTISGTPLDLRNHRLLAMAEAERHFLEAEYDEYDASNASGAAFCRSAALILMALLFFRHALAIPDSDGEDDVSTFFSLFLLRAAGFLLPCYIMAWAINILQRRRQRQVSVSCFSGGFFPNISFPSGIHFAFIINIIKSTIYSDISFGCMSKNYYTCLTKMGGRQEINFNRLISEINFQIFHLIFGTYTCFETRIYKMPPEGFLCIGFQLISAVAFF